MGLKYQITKLDEVNEAIRHLYVPQGSVFVLDAEGVVPKERLDEFRNNNITLQQTLEKFKNVDPAKYAELMALQQQVDEGKLIKEGKLDEVVELRTKTMKATYEGQLTTTTTQLAAARNQLATLMIDNVIKTAAIKTGVIPGAVDDVVLRAKGVYHIDENGAAVPKDAKGQVIYGKDGSTPMPVEEWLNSLKTTASHLFVPTSGGGARGGNRAGGGGQGNLSPVQKIALGLGQSGGLRADLPLEGPRGS